MTCTGARKQPRNDSATQGGLSHQRAEFPGPRACVAKGIQTFQGPFDASSQVFRRQPSGPETADTVANVYMCQEDTKVPVDIFKQMLTKDSEVNGDLRRCFTAVLLQGKDFKRSEHDKSVDDIVADAKPTVRLVNVN